MIKSKFKLILITALVATAVSIGSYFILLSRFNIEKTDTNNTLKRPYDQLFGWQYPVAMFPEAGPVTEQIAYSTIRDPGGMPQGLPVRLKIPTISVDSTIEDALITPDGRMDVPYGSVNVAWFSLGPKPGHEGSAVIGGHFGINAGVKFVFYDLDKLKINDRIYIIDDNSKTLAFKIRKIELFERNADATTIFTSNDGLAHLNLITCEGIWNRANDTYPLRRVIFTDAVSAEEAVEANTTFFRSLSIGAIGEDVIELQTILEKKGFLIIPRGVSKGYFGTLTSAATVKYQVSMGIPSTGIFDSTTRAKLIPATVVTMEPTLPSTSIIPKSQSLPQVIIEHIRSLYSTPKDGLITSILLIMIIFTAFILSKNRF